MQSSKEKMQQLNREVIKLFQHHKLRDLPVGLVSESGDQVNVSWNCIMNGRLSPLFTINGEVVTAVGTEGELTDRQVVDLVEEWCLN